MNAELPYVDEHAITIPASRQAVWEALERYVASSVDRAERNPLTTLLGTEPRGGFTVTRRVPSERLELVGRHRFSRYRLEFELDDDAGGRTRLRALTYAVFPGLHGRAYRVLVIGTRLHVVATGHLLRSVRRQSIDAGRG
jgi:hypothetical protein